MLAQHTIIDLPDFRARVRALLALRLPPESVILRAARGDAVGGEQGGLFVGPMSAMPVAAEVPTKAAAPTSAAGPSSAAPVAAEVPTKAATPTSAAGSSSAAPAAGERAGPPPRLPARLAEAVREAAHHSDPGRWQLLYRVIWRQLTAPGAPVLEHRLDADVVRLERLRAQVKRDVHRCHAFLRFRPLRDPQGEIWGAWYEPDHDVLPLALSFFVTRLGDARWWVASSRRSAAFNGHTLSWLPGRRPPASPPSSPTGGPHADETERLWGTYFSAIFNPARLNPRGMRQHMPRRFWRNLPEAPLVPTLVREASARQESAMRSDPSPRPELQLSLLGGAGEPAAATQDDASPAARLAADARARGGTLRALADSALTCGACAWACDATQTVFGRGPEDAAVMLVGEQPGDQEDIRGAPFVGPAGQLLREILAEVPLDPDACYLTNAVKHFKWTPRGKRRIHQKPSARDIATCRPWLTAEQQVLRPRLTIALGLVAAHSLMGKAVRLGDIRGRRLALPTCDNTWVTSHPSAILRMPEPSLQTQARELMIRELKEALATV